MRFPDRDSPSHQSDVKCPLVRIHRELVTARAELDRSTSAVARASGPAADALMAHVPETQERQTALDNQDVDPAVGLALAQSTDVWDLLLTPERERVVRLLIARVDYPGQLANWRSRTKRWR